MSKFQALLSLVIPVLILFLVLLGFESEQNSTGSGYIIGYGTIILVIPTSIILLVVVLLQNMKWRMKFYKSLIINFCITLGWSFFVFTLLYLSK